MVNRYGLRKKKNGQVILLVTFAMVPMIGMLGLVTDVGYMHYVKKSAQTAADAAVMAAISRFHSDVGGSTYTCDQTGVSCGTSYVCPADITVATNARDTACLYAKQNGFRATGKQNVLVDSNVGTSPPSTAPGLNAAAFWISVRVAQKVPQLFAAITGNPNGLVAARATAAVTPAKDCIYVLDPSTSGAFYQNGNTTVSSACGIYVNSNSSTAMYNSGGSSSLSAPEYDVVGNYQWNGTLSPTPNVGAPKTPDPLASLPTPSPCSSTGGCNSADCSTHNGQTNISGGTIANPNKVWPGTYCGGIHVGNGVAEFQPGQFIIVGGGISTQSSNSIVRGTGAFFYNTYNSSNDYGAMSFSANSDVQLAAPLTGTYSGILFMQDRNCCSTMPDESFQGGASAQFEGVLYFPKSSISFAGNPTASTTHYTIIVALRLSVKGDSTIKNDYSQLSGGSPIQQVGLVE